MAYIKPLFDHNFLEYASYVIKDRAIPHLDDGLKPVQRRILHSLFEKDDGKFNKVANIVGHTMQYHPHGDASIYEALVNLANKDLFIDKQGNFGNIYTGDPASAARYIECRLLPLAKEVLFHPEITDWEDSYDGRNREPRIFPAKIPVVLLLGAEGIAVGMATKILPHNFVEVLEAVRDHLKGKESLLFPDFPTGGLIDVAEYADGNGKVLVRARLDTSDPKKIIVRELPYGCTTESLIASIEDAARANKLKISSINDFTTAQVEIEINLSRGVYTAETVDALFAFTQCESSISVNLLVIREGRPTVMPVSEVIAHGAGKLKDVLWAELKLEEMQLREKIFARTLEKIFIMERIYQRIEEMKTQDAVRKAVYEGFLPFRAELARDLKDEDIEQLLKIPIRRISLYDINRMKDELRDLEARLKEVCFHQAHLNDYAIAFLEQILKKYGPLYPRRTQIVSFTKVDVREAAQRNLKLRYDKASGYLGYEVDGTLLFEVSDFDRVLCLRKSGMYSIFDVPAKMFIDKGMWWCGLADKEALAKTVFSALFRDDKTGFPYVKRCTIEGWILNKGYSLIPENCTMLAFTTEESVRIEVEYKPKPRLKVLDESFRLQDYLVKGAKAGGVRLAGKEVRSARFVKTAEEAPTLELAP